MSGSGRKDFDVKHILRLRWKLFSHPSPSAGGPAAGSCLQQDGSGSFEHWGPSQSRLLKSQEKGGVSTFWKKPSSSASSSSSASPSSSASSFSPLNGTLLPVATRLQPGAPGQGIPQPARTLFYVESLEEEEVPGMDFPGPHDKGLVPQEFKAEPANSSQATELNPMDQLFKNTLPYYRQVSDSSDLKNPFYHRKQICLTQVPVKSASVPGYQQSGIKSINSSQMFSLIENFVYKKECEKGKWDSKRLSETNHLLTPQSDMDSGSSEEFYQAVHHAEQTFRKMESYLKQQQLCDVILIVGNRKIPAHRYSDNQDFPPDERDRKRERERKESDREREEIRVPVKVVHVRLRSCLELKEETIENLLAAACLLQLPQVVEVCCHFLMKLLHPSNCLGIRAFADAQGCIELMKVAHSYTMIWMQPQVGDRTGSGQGLGAMREIKDNMQFDKVFIRIRPLMAYVSQPHCLETYDESNRYKVGIEPIQKNGKFVSNKSEQPRMFYNMNSSKKGCEVVQVIQSWH
ncbi:KLHL1 [Cervus elaphus hippelaphus]|uniref:KLHL1 n=1 Tax=Cervus elaphus hippelaphus TaxID=46360 RepID=A0A212C3X4_CEREH|nr:KLHL1 [Cervus elaphus hippelaphus]